MVKIKVEKKIIILDYSPQILEIINDYVKKNGMHRPPRIVKIICI